MRAAHDVRALSRLLHQAIAAPSMKAPRWRRAGVAPR
jgi:hypothetical protein